MSRFVQRCSRTSKLPCDGSCQERTESWKKILLELDVLQKHGPIEVYLGTTDVSVAFEWWLIFDEIKIKNEFFLKAMNELNLDNSIEYQYVTPRNNEHYHEQFSIRIRCHNVARRCTNQMWTLLASEMWWECVEIFVIDANKILYLHNFVGSVSSFRVGQDRISIKSNWKDWCDSAQPQPNMISNHLKEGG